MRSSKTSIRRLEVRSSASREHRHPCLPLLSAGHQSGRDACAPRRFQRPNMTRKICIVTGANTGIGKETALGLAKLGASVVMVCRDHQRGEAALLDIKQK